MFLSRSIYSVNRLPKPERARLKAAAGPELLWSWWLGGHGDCRSLLMREIQGQAGKSVFSLGSAGPWPGVAVAELETNTPTLEPRKGVAAQS